jgi:hypothetical protein
VLLQKYDFYVIRYKNASLAQLVERRKLIFPLKWLLNRF